MTWSDNRAFETASNCHICNDKFDCDKVHDHDHLTGRYRGAAHKQCSLKYQVHKKIPVIFHNLRGFDSHIIVKNLNARLAEGKEPRVMTAIAKTMESYITFTIGALQFIDSLQFLNASLDTLVKNFCSDGLDKFKILKQFYPNDERKRNLATRKLPFPYDYFDSFDRFSETALPSKQAFYNRLTEKEVSEEDYSYAEEVWNEFNCRNLGEFQDVYVTADVLSLADVFENFRNIAFQNYGLDCLQRVSLPGYSLQCMLKLTNVKIELLQDIDMYLFLEKNIHSGVSMISKRLSTANNRYLPDYDPSKPSKYLMYLDSNNLYGWAMSQPMPISDFKWLSRKEIDMLDISSVPDDAEVGYILQVDLDYPAELHDLHSSYPLASESMDITEEMLSPYNKSTQC
jgi:hypothetical protein